MANLVQIPWQPQMWLTPDTLALLVAASNRLGTKLQVVSPDGAWRSYARQKALWDAYQRYLAGGPFANMASNPDNGQRNHMKGAAFDLIRTDATAQAACRAVGLIRDGVEKWHWNNPRWASMPIIPVNTSTAGGGGTPLTPEEEENMKIISNGSAQYFMNGSDITHITPDESTALQLAGVKVYVMTHPQVQAIEAALNRTVLPDLATKSAVTASVDTAVGNALASLKQDLGYLNDNPNNPNSLAAIRGAIPAAGGGTVDVDALATAIVAKLPVAGAGLTKADVVDALKSVTYKAA